MKALFTLHVAKSLLTLKGGSRYQRNRVVLTTLLITVITIPLILSLIFMDGMIEGITQKYITLQDGHIQLYTSKEISDPFDNRVESADFVVAGFGVIYSKTNTHEVRIKGVEPSYFNDVRSKQLSYSSPIFETTGSLASVMLSKTIAEKLEVGIGDRVAFMVVPDSSKSVVRPLLATVTALYESGYHELDNQLLFMNRESALTYFPSQKNGYTEVLVKSNYTDQLDEIVEPFKESYRYATWDEFNKTVYQNFITSRQVIFLVFLLILIVAGVYIASIAQESVQDSLQSIALYKTMGSTNRSLFWGYFIALSSINIFGLAVGIGIAIYIGKRIGPLLSWLSNQHFVSLQYYLLTFDSVIIPSDIGIIVVAMLVISTLSLYLTLTPIQHISPLKLLQQE